ncbi:23S rRNA (adenine(2503)-C(2))-methyltransferase RlmN [bacterium]|nr:23S rRNA (adenine(2503)-C(2))-methyltransferase RlmN [bacterium]
MVELLGLEPKEIAALIGGPEYRSMQVFEWLYHRGVQDFSAMTNLPRELRDQLAANFTATLPEVVEVQHSSDGTSKYALRAGTEIIESVHMPEEGRETLCISSQAGCSFGCKFCVTARMNLRRHLTAGEIVGQVLLAIKTHGRPLRLNIVFMGMGEPMHNYDNVMKAFRIMTHPRALAISPRRITVSTVGFIPSLLRLKSEPVIPNIAVSLNAPSNKLRNDLMPINRIYPIEKLMKTLQELPLKHRQRITFEYVLLKGVNDSPEHAQQLVEITRAIKSKINLIPLNPDPHLPYERPEEQTIDRFASVLVRAGRTVAIRRSRGPDISAACGQLGTHYIDPKWIPLSLT